MGANFSVSQFKEAVAQSGGFARPIFFDCKIDCTYLTSLSLNLAAEDIILCKATNIPEETIETTDVKYFTRPVSIPGARQYQPLTITFYNTTNYKLRNYFEEWVGAFNGRGIKSGGLGNNRKSNPLSELTGTVRLTHWNNNGAFKLSWQTSAQLAVSAVTSSTNRITSAIGSTVANSLGLGGSIESNNPPIQFFEFINAYPISLGQLTFSQEDDATVQTFDVTFKYLHMYSGRLDQKTDQRNILDKIGDVLSGNFKVGK